MAEVAVAIGPENAPDSIVVTISDDQPFSPDQVDDACRRAADTALRLYHDLHPADVKGA